MIKPTYNTATGICWYDNAVPAGLCNDIISLFEEHQEKQKPGITMSGLGNVKVTTDMSIFPPGDTETGGVVTELDVYLSGFVQDVVRDYILKFDWLGVIEGTVDTGFLIQKYAANSGQYGEHVDGDPWTEGINTRICGMIVYLNTVHDGGGTYFRYQDVYINAVQGRMAIFPASWMHPHAGTVPLSNDKYIVSSFLHPMRIYQINQ